jgi:KipI family sensor histidine kinase inhibitor
VPPAEPPPQPAVLPFGDDAILVDLREPIGIRAARRAGALAVAIDALRAERPWLGAPIAGAASVLVRFDAGPADTTAATRAVAPLVAALPADPAPPPGAVEHRFRVRYGGEHGPDLAGAAALAGLAPDELVARHADTVLEVLFLGFAPGFAYLGVLPGALVVPRLATARPRVPAGSVAIADRLTAIYPHASPGGWRIIGRTDARLFDPSSERPVTLRPGDRVRFVPE